MNLSIALVVVISINVIREIHSIGPLAIQDSQDFMEGNHSSNVVLEPTASSRSSGYRHRRQKTVSFDKTIEKIHIKRRSERMPKDNSQSGPLAIQDSQDFLKGDHSSNVVLEPAPSSQSSVYLHRRQKTVPFDEAMKRVHMIAGITSSIYIQGALFNGTIEPKKLISEMLLFNPVTPDQINSLDYAKFEGPLNQLKELPEKVETGGGIADLEKFFDFVRQVLGHIKGVENVEKWPDQEVFKKDLERLISDGGEISFATGVEANLRDWISFHQNTVKQKPADDFGFVEALIDTSKNILADASPSNQKVFTFTNKKKPSQSVELLKNVINAGKFIDSSGMPRPTDGYNELTNKVKIVNDTLASLRDIQDHLDQIENFFKSIASPWNLPPIKYTAGLPKGFKDVRQMLNDLERSWSLAIVKSKYLLESFASIKSLDNKVSEIDVVLGVGAADIAKTVTTIIQTFNHLEATFSTFESKDANQVVKCYRLPNFSMEDTELKELIECAINVENEIEKLKNGSEELRNGLRNTEGRQHLEELVKAFEKYNQNDPATADKAITAVSTSPALPKAKKFVDALYAKAVTIMNDNLIAKAKIALGKISSFETFVLKHKDEHLKILKCFIGNNETSSTLAVIEELRKIEAADEEYAEMVDKGLEGVKKMVGIKDKLTALEKTITGLKGTNPASQNLLNMLVDPEKLSNIIGHSTRGVFNMKRLLDLGLTSKDFKIYNMLVRTETNKHSKILSKEQVDILKKYPLISTKLEALHSKLTDFSGKFSSKNTAKVTDISEIFTLAKDVPGISLDFGQMVDALDKVIKLQKGKSKEKKLLKKVRKNLVGLSSIGLDFNSYHQYFDKYKDSAQDLDLFFTKLEQTASMRSSGISFHSHRKDKSCENAERMTWWIFIVIVLAICIALAIVSGILIQKKVKKWIKEQKEND